MNFFGMGPMEILVIMVVALIIFGPGRLPEIGASIGKAVRDFRSATQELTGEFTRTMDEVQDAADEVKASAMEVQDVTREAVRLDQAFTSTTAPARRGASGPAAFVSNQVEVSATPSKADPLADLMFGGSGPAPSAVQVQPVDQPGNAVPVASAYTFGGNNEPDSYEGLPESAASEPDEDTALATGSDEVELDEHQARYASSTRTTERGENDPDDEQRDRTVA